MGWEIERKFLIGRLPGDITRTKPVNISQGYLILCENGPELRIRSMGKRYYLTIKGEGSLKRKEIETEITKAPFNSLYGCIQRASALKNDDIQLIMDHERYLLMNSPVNMPD
jgi:CYTH domain-containing protein